MNKFVDTTWPFDIDDVVISRELLAKLYSLYHVVWHEISPTYSEEMKRVTYSIEDDQLIDAASSAIEPYEAEIAKALAR